DFHFVPILRAVMLELFVRPGQRIIAALQLRPADVDAAVRIGRSAELEPQREVVREFGGGVELLNLPAFGWRRDNEPSVLRLETTIGRAGLAVKTDGVGDERPCGGV